MLLMREMTSSVLLPSNPFFALVVYFKAEEPEPFGSLGAALLPGPALWSQLLVGSRSLGASSKLCLFMLEKK